MIRRLKELLFASGSTRKVVFKNFLWLGISQVGSRLVRASITVYSARALGAENYGVFSYALGLAGFFIFFKNIGVDGIMTRDIAKDPESREKIFSTGFWIEIALLVVTAILLIFIAPWFSTVKEASILLPIIAIMIIADDLRDFVVAFFRGIEKMEWEALIVTAANVFVTVFGFIALALVRSPLSLTIAYAFASVVVTLISFAFLFRRYGSKVVRHFDKSAVAPMLRSAWPIAVLGLPGVFIFNVDLVMLGWWRSVSEIGIYSAAQKIVGILSVFPNLIGTSTFPVFARFVHQKDESRTRALVEDTFRMIFAFCVPVFFGGALLAAPLLSYIFGTEYAAGAGAFVIFLFTIFATYPLAILTNFIFAHDMQKRFIYYPFISAGMNLVLNYILVPRYGMIGASIASLASFFVYALLMYFLAKKIQRFALFRRPARIIVSAAIMSVMTVAMLMFGVHVMVNVTISAFVYIAMLYILKDESINDVAALFHK